MAVIDAISGTGRIGMTTTRMIGQREDVELTALNTTAELAALVHVFRFDTVHKEYGAEKIDHETVRIGNNENVKVFSDRDPS